MVDQTDPAATDRADSDGHDSRPESTLETLRESTIDISNYVLLFAIVV